MRIIREKYRAGAAFDAEPLKGLIGKKYDVFERIIALGNLSTQRKRTVSNQVNSGKAVLHINVVAVCLKPGTVVPFPLTLTDNSED